jgi:hypothetical protein
VVAVAIVVVMIMFPTFMQTQRLAGKNDKNTSLQDVGKDHSSGPDSQKDRNGLAILKKKLRPAHSGFQSCLNRAKFELYH